MLSLFRSLVSYADTGTSTSIRCLLLPHSYISAFVSAGLIQAFLKNDGGHWPKYLEWITMFRTPAMFPSTALVLNIYFLTNCLMSIISLIHFSNSLPIRSKIVTLTRVFVEWTPPRVAQLAWGVYRKYTHDTSTSQSGFHKRVRFSLCTDPFNPYLYMARLLPTG